MIEHALLPPSHRLARFAGKLLADMKEKRRPAIYLIDGKAMRRLNREFRGKDKPTDVLSFEFPADFPVPKGEKRPLGEIYLNPAYIKKNGETLEYLLTHGILHLLGFNHIKKSDRIRMEKLEEKILKKFSASKFINAQDSTHSRTRHRIKRH